MIEPESVCLCCFRQLREPKGICPYCGCDNSTVSNESHQLECGSILAGTYLIGKVLGQGGFGITYVGWDLNLNMKVAIKEYYPEGCVTRDTHTHVTVLTYTGAKDMLFQKNKDKFASFSYSWTRGDYQIYSVYALMINDLDYYVLEFTVTQDSYNALYPLFEHIAISFEVL